MRALAAALAVSIALHAAAFAALPRFPRQPRPPASVEPATVDIEISTSGGAGALSTVERRPRVRLRARARPQLPTSLSAEPRRSTPTLIATATPNTTATPTANTAATPTANTAANTTPTLAPEGQGSSELADLDLTAFFDRLQRAAERCAGPRAGEGRVRFCVGADGAPTDVSLVQTTGNFALDDAALHCVVPGAAPFPRTNRCLVVPLAFH